MLRVAFHALSLLDSWLSPLLPLPARICCWGLFAGVAAIGLYSLSSNQPAIAGLKSESRKLRRRMLDPALETQAEYLKLATMNLRVAFRLASKVLGPATLSALPVLVLALWLHAYHGYSTFAEGVGIPLDTRPAVAELGAEPGERLQQAGEDGLLLLPPAEPGMEVSISVGNRTVYVGDPFHPPAPRIGWKRWWSLIVPAPAGYLVPAAPIEELRLQFPRKRVVGRLPASLAGWELPFFLCVAAVALTLKLLFKIR